MTSDLIESHDPLEPTTPPAEIVEREAELETLAEMFDEDTEARLQNLHVSGPRGTGKTTILRQFLETLPATVTTCYLSGISHNTQYKALEHLYTQLSGTKLGPGHHVAEIQRRIDEQTTLPTIIVLDEVDFLLRNDGDDLLYFLTRLDKTAVITVSANRTSLQPVLDARTYSSFQPQVLRVEPYLPAAAARILADRARNALRPQSLHRAALSQIAQTTQNITLGLIWLREAAETADDRITPDTVQAIKETACHEYVLHLLADFTPHHRRLYEAIARLEQVSDHPPTTGTVYREYCDHCEAADIVPLSERRVSDFLTHLELLDIIDATYHYGGAEGKTREISLADWHSQPE